MAIRVKTVEYVVPTLTDTRMATGINLTQSTSQFYEFPAITCSFPESGSRTFKSVMAEYCWNDWFSVATNLSGVEFGISSGSVSASYVRKTYGVSQGFSIQTNTADPQNFTWLVDFTPEVTDSSFGIGELSGVFQLSARIATVISSSITNLSAKLYFTYEYEDSTALKLVKTVRIPIQSHHTTLLTTMSQVGVFTGAIPAPINQIPALNTFLPETDGRVIHQAWIEMYSNNAGIAATNFSAAYQIDNSASAQSPRALYQMALIGGALTRDIWIYDTGSYVIDTSHSFNAASSVVTRMETIGGFLGVTYSYNNNAATNPTRLNSILVGTDTFNKPLYINGSGSGDMDFRLIEVNVPENNPVLRQSAFVYHVMAPGGGIFGAEEFKQTLSRSYTLANLVNAGGSMIHHRIDHSGTTSLIKGKNVLTSAFLFNSAGRL